MAVCVMIPDVVPMAIFELEELQLPKRTLVVNTGLEELHDAVVPLIVTAELTVTNAVDT